MKPEYSFQEILEKVLHKQERESHKNTGPHFASSIDFSIPPFFIECPRATAHKPLRSYPITERKKEALTHKTEPEVIIHKKVQKNTLNEEAQQKWNLFEKMIGKSLGIETSRIEASSLFRKFIKTIHPDLNQEKQSYNFANFVKIKNEFIKILEQHS